MLTYMLDTNICIYVMKNYPLELREKFNAGRATLHLDHYPRGAL
jgi:predicted nucleic acid-binding protein